MSTQKLPGFATRAERFEGAPNGALSESKTIEIPFSSEAPYKRFDWERGESYLEVLGHGSGEVDLTFLNSGAAPLLKDHEARLDAQIGVIERAWLETGQGRAVVRFSDTPAAQDVLARVRAGDVTCVSVGYAVTQAKKDGAQDGVPLVRVTRWVPREISFVAIPADASVGYGRSDLEGAAQIPVTEPDALKEADMPKDIDTSSTTPTTPAAPKSAARSAEPDTNAAVADALSAERTRVAAIEEIATRFDMPAEATRAALQKGTSVDAFREAVMDHMASDEVDATRAAQSRIGLSEREVQAFSVTNAVRFLSNPSAQTRERAAFEIEASRAVADQLGSDPGGLYIPSDVLMQSSFMRAQNTGDATAGGNLVAQDYRAGSFIDLLRNKMALSGVGVRILQGLKGNVDIPKQTGTGTMYWFGEDGAPQDSQAGFGLVSMTPHSAGMAIPITRRMMQQSSPDIEALVRNDLITGMALGLDKTALVGHASDDAPTSLREMILAGALEWAEFPHEDDLIDLETAVADGNADEGALAYIYSPRTSGHLKKLRDSDGRPLNIEKGAIVNGYNRVRTKQIGDGEVAFGNWSDLIIGMWSGLDLRVDTATKAASDGTVLRVFTDIDVAARNLESFKWGRPTA